MKLVVTSHCILNQNAKLEGIAGWPGAIREVLDVLVNADCGIIQMGCPEMLYEGIGRFDKSVEQYRCAAFESVCAQIVKDTLDQVENYLRWDYSVRAILAIDGSPSCGFAKTQTAPEWRGLVAAQSWKPVRYIDAPGVLMEHLEKELSTRNIDVPILGIPEIPRLGSLDDALAQLGQLVS